MPLDGGAEVRGSFAEQDALVHELHDAPARVRLQLQRYPLAAKVEGRVMLLRGYGNSIVAQCGAAFIQAFLEVEGDRDAE